jgi:hypothetical protein
MNATSKPPKHEISPFPTGFRGHSKHYKMYSNSTQKPQSYRADSPHQASPTMSHRAQHPGASRAAIWFEEQEKRRLVGTSLDEAGL